MSGERRDNPERGFVWLVGAGPGNPGLLTLRGREVLAKAQVVVFDRLVGAGLFAYFPPDAELIDVGKNAGSHPVPQREIEGILIGEALKGLRVVRLKGGDPFLFGRGGEECAALMERGIPCEVVPGVTSAISVPAFAGIPVTHRGAASGVTVVSAHGSGGRDDLDYANLAASRNTLVFLMGAKRISKISANLIEHGKSGSTPAAVIESGTTSSQRTTYGTLADLPEIAESAEIASPAILVVGTVASLSGQMDWRSSFSMCGSRVWLTMQASALAGSLAERLRDEGAEVVEAPCIAVHPRHAELPELGSFDWIAFTSRAGVVSFFDALRSNKVDIRSMAGVGIAAVGPATRSELEQRGLLVDFVPSVYDGAHLAEGLARLGAEHVLLPRPEGGLPDWAQQAGCSGGSPAPSSTFESLPVYRVRGLELTTTARPCPDDIVVFASSGAVHAFSKFITDMDCKPKAVCIGTPTALAAEADGYETVTADESTENALFEAIADAVSSKTPIPRQLGSGRDDERQIR